LIEGAKKACVRLFRGIEGTGMGYEF
jgi:hypothetical protein